MLTDRQTDRQTDGQTDRQTDGHANLIVGLVTRNPPNEPTYMTSTSANILDLIFTDSPGFVTAAGTLPPLGTSKHAVVYCLCNRNVTREKPYKREIWKYQDADRDGLNMAIGDFPFDDILPDDINQATEIWTHSILTMAREFIPCHNITVHPQDKPWINHNIKKLIKSRNAMYRRYKRTLRADHWDVYSRVKADLNVSISEAKNEYKKKLISKLADVRNNPKHFWEVAKKVYGNKIQCNIPTLIDGTQHYSTSKAKASILAEHFAAQSQEPVLPVDYVRPEIHQRQSEHKLENIRITEDDVRAELRKLKTGKSVGPDGVSNELLKLITGSVVQSLTSLYNRVIQTGTYPDLWKQANVSPVHKKGSRQEKKNYRPISLLSTTGKVLERILFNKMYSFLTENNLLTWRNSGYKRRDSTTNRLIRIVNDIQLGLDRREPSCLVFLDQSKAFDRIHHSSLMRKLQVKGIDGGLLQLLSSYLHNRNIRVALSGAKSRWHVTKAGVPQGSILGPLLFLIYADDIEENLECDIHMYADDAVLIAKYTNPDTAVTKINRDLEKLNTWAEKWHMSFNPEKTKYMIIGNTNQPHPSLQLNDTQIDQVHSYQQLGVILNDKLNWEDHINHVISKANRKIGLMWKLSSELPRYAVENIYTSYIRPQLEYSAVIYNNCTREQSRRLEACQRKAAIACTRAYRRTNTENLLNELGWSKLEDRRT